MSNFPNPDGFEKGNTWRSREFEIFTYGDFELYFSNDILYLIFADFTGKIQEGNSIILKTTANLKSKESLNRADQRLIPKSTDVACNVSPKIK